MRKRSVLMVGGWLALLALSRSLESPRPAPGPAAGDRRLAVEIAPQGDQGPLEGGRASVSVLHWPPPAGSPSRPPLVCLHGSPGSARNFERLGPPLAAAGRHVWSIDLPGFGRSAGPVGGYSILAHARAVLAVLDGLGIERAHLIGWSMGGGVALHVADLAPRRVASLALVASIGVQETEGSGSWAFEHLKYLLLRGLLVGAERLLPHFGALSALRHEGRAFALNFWESDQRPLRGILAALETPTLILHGREDVLVPLRAAQVSHELVRSSRLVVLDASHFLPILQVDETVAEVVPFLERHDQAGSVEPRTREVAAARSRWQRLEPDVLSLGHALPWWLQLLALGAAGALAPFSAAVLGGALVAAAQLDAGLVAVALAAGALLGAGRGRRPGRRSWTAPLRAWGWMLLTVVLALLLAPLLGPAAPRSLAPLLALALLGGAALGLRRRGVRPSQRASQTVG
jgi:pimeloyl-ACP methyl ester carboxylesterase